MKAAFKPLSLAVAVASASYAGTIYAQDLALAGNTGLGDLAIVPYYTVNGGWGTGVSVINSSSETQVIKIRMRRAPDSMDALDFNVVMSPYDVWTGYAEKGEDDKIRWVTNDKSCTVPALEAGGFLTMPDIYREGADSGYIEIMGMGAADENQPIAIAALHQEDGEPLDCDKVRENFIRGATPADYAQNRALLPSTGTAQEREQGVINSALTMQSRSKSPFYETSGYTDTGNVLRVSYFIRSGVSGTEFGNDAVHIADFMDGATITNQRQGIDSGDLQGFDHPNLDGGAPTSVLAGWSGPIADFGVYEDLRNVLGSTAIINDWSANDTDLFDVNTDWVVTTPGQYLMTNLGAYIDSLEPGGAPCLPGVPSQDLVTDEDADDYGANCDFRDIPLTVSASVWDREEQVSEVLPEDLVVSPAPVTPPTIVTFDREVNVMQWGVDSVLDADASVVIPPASRPPGNAGWAKVSVTQWDDTEQGICEFTTWGSTPLSVSCNATDSSVPLVGFVAWERAFANQPASNFGRIVEHAYEQK